MRTPGRRGHDLANHALGAPTIRLAAAYLHVSLPGPARWAERRLVRIAAEAVRHVPFYADLARSAGLSAGDIRSADDVRGLPIVDAHLYREAFQRNGADYVLDARMREQCTNVQRSSGSTGQPLEIRRTPWEMAVNAAHTVRFLQRGGVRPFDRTLAFVTADRIAERDSSLQRFGVYRRTTVYFDRRLDDVIRLIERERINCVYGARGHIELLAQRLGASPGRAPFRSVLVGSEVVTDAARERIRAGFRPEIFGEYYGTTETGVIALRMGDRYRVLPRTVHVRLDEARDAEGLHGVLLSSLFMRAQPILNYRIGDRVRDPRVDASGRLESFDSIVGRDNDYVLTRSGRRWGSSRLYTLLDVPLGVLRFRIDQPAPGEITFTVMLDPAHRETAVPELEAHLARVLGDEFSYRIELRDDIPVKPSGKLAIVQRHFESPPRSPGDDASARDATPRAEGQTPG